MNLPDRTSTTLKSGVEVIGSDTRSGAMFQSCLVATNEDKTKDTKNDLMEISEGSEGSEIMVAECDSDEIE